MNKQEQLTLRIPADLAEDIKKLEEPEHIDRSTAVRRLLYAGIREWKLRHAATLYRANKVSLGKAAEEAVISIREMMDYLSQEKIPMQYDLDDFEKDLEGIYGRLPRPKTSRGEDQGTNGRDQAA